MPAGKLTVEVVATTDKLDQGLSKADAALKKTADSMGDVSKGAQSFTDKAVKFLAVLGMAEAAMKGFSVGADVASGLMSGLAGDTEAMNESLDGSVEKLFQMPLGIGPVVQAFSQMADSFVGSAAAMEDAAKALEEMKRIEAIADAAESYKESLTQGSLSLLNQLDLLREQDATQKAILTAEIKRAAALKALEERREAAEKQLGRSLANRNQLNKEFENQKRLIREVAEEEVRIAIELKKQEEARIAAEQTAAKILEAEKEKAALLKEQARIDKEKARAAEKAEREQAKIEKQRTAEIEKQTKIREDAAKSLMIAQQEVAQAKSDAESAAAGATASISTAGGSFTIGVSAEVNEAKLSNKISQGSQEILRKLLDVGIQMARGGLA